MTDLKNVSPPSGRPLRAAVIGMGGFAVEHHWALHNLEKSGQCQVIAACDPQPAQHDALMAQCQFEQRAIPIYSDFLEMLDKHGADLDLVTVPTPIPMHAAMHRACVERDIACYLEKPPTLCIHEMDRMLDIEDTARRQTQVGFLHIVEPARLQIKQRLVAGEFGAMRQVSFYGCAPRNTGYFQRAPWAGRIQLNGRLVLDSCIGNATSHHIHNLLFWCGQTELLSWETIDTLEAELYRAHDIENFDTCFARGHCRNGVEVRVAATHTGQPNALLRESIHCEHATIYYTIEAGAEFTVRWNDGTEEHYPATQQGLLQKNLLAFLKYLNGETARPLTRLVDARSFVDFNALLYLAAGQIHSMPFDRLPADPPFVNADWLIVKNLPDIMSDFCRNGEFPGETEVVWGERGGYARMSQVQQIDESIQRLISGPVSCI